MGVAYVARTGVIVRQRVHWTARWGRRLAILAGLVLASMMTLNVAQAAGLAPQLARLIHGHHLESSRVAPIGEGPAAVVASHTAFTQPLAIPPVLTGANIMLTAAETDVQILAGQPTKMWTYNGSSPGPTIRRPTGQTTQVTLVNNLPVAAGEL